MLRHKHVLVRTDSTATVAYINHQGGLRSRRMSQLARRLLLWRELNRAADQLSQQSTHRGEWRLHPQLVQLIWSHFGEAQIDLFASPESSHCQLFYSLSEAPLGRDALAHSWPPGPKYAFPPVSLLAQTLCKIREDEEQVLLVAPYWPTRTCPSLEDLLEERPSFSGDGHNLAPAPRPMEPARLAPGRDTSDLSGLSQAVIETITQSRASSTRQAYALRWGLFVDWCSSRGEDPQRCPTAVVLSFLQEKLERRLSPSTLKAYVAAIAAYHDAVDGTSLGKHQLIVRFLRGARRVNPPRLHLVPSWDLSVVLQCLREAPFETLASVELKHLSLKTALLTALASIKRVGDLQAFSVDETCLEFGPGDSHVILRPRPGYVPKVPTTPFRDQVVNLQALPLEEADPASALLCPVRALRIYVDRTQHFRCTEQFFVCFGGQQKGNAVSKQRLAHWVVDAISLSYQRCNEHDSRRNKYTGVGGWVPWRLVQGRHRRERGYASRADPGAQEAMACQGVRGPMAKSIVQVAMAGQGIRGAMAEPTVQAAMAGQGVRGAMAKSIVQAAMAGQGVRGAMAEHTVHVAVVGQGIRGAKAKHTVHVAMVGQGIRGAKAEHTVHVAMAGQGIQEAMAEHKVHVAMAGQGVQEAMAESTVQPAMAG
ncbi:hypothetical protein H4Q32_026197 [Labeo rohita]|uniref:Core-binding (CB) domain-containing protein n=1 Tax=Labeo rohita TaxID=84645 RepID=A0ABQ8KZM1_LABRO|nr:hypothetical protein H4Q32_026197 [Labeo rohita]